MSGFRDKLYDHNQQHRERREERRDARHERHDHGRYDDEGGRGYGAPPARGPPGFSSQGGLDRGDFASDTDIDRMLASGAFEGRRDAYDRYDPPSGLPQGYGRGNEQGRDAPSGPPPGRRQEYASGGGYGGPDRQSQDWGSGGRYDTPPGPPPGRRQEYESSGGGYGGPDRQSQDWGSGGRYDTPSGPPPGRRQEYESSGGGYGGGPDRQSQDWSKPPAAQGNAGRYDTPSGPPPGRRQEYESSGGGYGGGPDRQNQDWLQQPQGRTQYDSKAPQHEYGKGSSNTPSGGFSTSREGEDQYRSGYGGPRNDRDDPPRRGEASSYYNQGPSGQGDRYSHLAGIPQGHGNDDPEVYRRATQGLQDRVQAQQPSRRNDEDDDYRTHADAHRKAYGDDDHGPMDADAIGAAAAVEAIKQTAGAGGPSNTPAGGFTAGGSSSKPGRAPRAEEAADEEEAAATRAGGSGSMQDKLVALAMSQAGKLFDKKNPGASGGNQTQDKAQAMQSAAATAMQLFTKYQGSGKLESGDMSTVMGLAMKML